MNWAALVPFVVWLVQWIAGRIDEAERSKLASAVLALSFIREANDAIAKAKAARAAAAARDADPDGLRKSDGFRRD